MWKCLSLCSRISLSRNQGFVWYLYETSKLALVSYFQYILLLLFHTWDESLLCLPRRTETADHWDRNWIREVVMDTRPQKMESFDVLVIVWVCIYSSPQPWLSLVEKVMVGVLWRGLPRIHLDFQKLVHCISKKDQHRPEASVLTGFMFKLRLGVSVCRAIYWYPACGQRSYYPVGSLAFTPSFSTIVSKWVLTN